MGFLKNFREDLSQAVNELLPEEELLKSLIDDDEMVNTFDKEPIELQLDRTESAGKGEATEHMRKSWDDSGSDNISENDLSNGFEVVLTDEIAESNNLKATSSDEYDEQHLEYEMVEGEIMSETKSIVMNNSETDILSESPAHLTREKPFSEANQNDELPVVKKMTPSLASSELKDEVIIVTKGTTINGSVVSDGSLEVMGTILGDIDCLGKLTILGEVVGNTMASEVFVNARRLMGSINSEGSVKINAGTVIIGDITASSAVIAGAVKGQIDISGPVIIDSTAIIKGNINAKSIQINNGAVIQGFCSLLYSDVDIDSVFEK